MDSENRISDNKGGIFCVGKHKGNGAWIYLGSKGQGIITRYAGTSVENLITGFEALENILHVKNIVSEYEL